MPHVPFSSVRLVIVRDSRYLEEETDVEKLILLVKDHEAIFNTSRCEHRNQDYIASVWLKIAQEMGVGKWSASMFTLMMILITKTTTLTTVMFLLLLGLIFKVFIRYFWCSK